MMTPSILTEKCTAISTGKEHTNSFREKKQPKNKKKTNNLIMYYSDEAMAGGVNDELKSGCKDQNTGLSIIQGVCT